MKSRPHTVVCWVLLGIAIAQALHVKRETILVAFVFVCWPRRLAYFKLIKNFSLFSLANNLLSEFCNEPNRSGLPLLGLKRNHRRPELECAPGPVTDGLSVQTVASTILYVYQCWHVAKQSTNSFNYAEIDTAPTGRELN